MQVQRTTALTLILAALGYALAAQSPYVANACSNLAVPNAFVYNGFCAFKWASDLTYPRHMRVSSNNDVLMTDFQEQKLYVFWENALGQVNKSVLINSGLGINHGLSIRGPYLYASSATNVYRWPYTPGNRTLLTGVQTVIYGIPGGGHNTRAIEFDKQGNLYVQVGSGSNVDSNSNRAHIRKFDISNLPSGGVSWTSGYIFADGLRNEAGIRFDAQNVLWGVENGRDDLRRDDLGDIHEENPAEELNRFSVPGKFYGYPYCWSEFNVTSTPNYPRGTQWADGQVFPNSPRDDSWCRNTSNVVTPAYTFDGHKAPLDIIFNNAAASFKVLPAANAFVAFHGSTRRQVYVGYSVSMIQFTKGNPVAEVPFFGFAEPGAKGPGWPYRPVGLAWYKCLGKYNCLLVSNGGGTFNSDKASGGSIIAIINKNQ